MFVHSIYSQKLLSKYMKIDYSFMINDENTKLVFPIRDKNNKGVQLSWDYFLKSKQKKNQKISWRNALTIFTDKTNYTETCI